MNKPLAELLRPASIDEMVGSDLSHVNVTNPQSMILWGAPGCGKTTFAKIVAKESKLQVVVLSAVTSSTAQYKNVFDLAERGARILLHVDEIHHLNKSQQDIFLPHLEQNEMPQTHLIFQKVVACRFGDALKKSREIFWESVTAGR